MASSDSIDTTTLATLAALEHRLQRLTFYLTGSTTTTELSVQLQVQLESKERTTNLQSRLVDLEAQLAQLAERKPGIRGLLDLQSKHPDLFDISTTAPTSAPAPAPLLPPPHLLALTSSLAPEIQTTASRLTSLQDLLPLPPPSELTPLLSTLAPRIARAELRQDELERDIGELRERSTRVLERWMDGGVVGGGEIWGEWEGRVGRVETSVRRKEVEREKESREV